MHGTVSLKFNEVFVFDGVRAVYLQQQCYV